MNIPIPDIRPKEIHTRFLYPFFFDKDKVGEAYEALLKANITTRDGKEMAFWDSSQPLALYKEELLEHVDRFLFERSENGCRYLRLANAASSRWFNNVQVILF